MVQKRCVLVYPNFENRGVIDAIRDKYDPLCNVIDPHITLVFPFGSDLSARALAEHTQEALLGFEPFHLRMKGLTASIEPDGNYLFLNVAQGLQELYGLSRKLYTGILAEYQSDLYRARYCPHITVGKLGKSEDHRGIIRRIGNQETEFACDIDCVHIEIIKESDSAILEVTHEMTLQLGRP